MSDQDTIDQLYPSVTPVQTEEVDVDIQEVECTENFGYEPELEAVVGNPYSLDKDSIEDSLYGATSKVTLNDDTDLSIIYQSEEEQAALKNNLGYMASETGASQDDIHSLVSHANKQLTTGATSDPTASMSTLYEQHGAELSSKLSDAQALISTFPELILWLDQTQLGNDPIVINHIIRIAQSPRAQARLQKALKGNRS